MSVALGGRVCVHLLQADASSFFIVVALSLIVYGATIAGSIRLGSGRDERTGATQARHRRDTEYDN